MWNLNRRVIGRWSAALTFIPPRKTDSSYSIFQASARFHRHDYKGIVFVLSVIGFDVVFSIFKENN